MFVSTYRQTELLEKPHTLVDVSTQEHVFHCPIFLASIMLEGNKYFLEIWHLNKNYRRFYGKRYWRFRDYIFHPSG